MKTAQRDVLVQTLKKRFESHMHRHPTVVWADVHERLTANKLKALQDMEATGGEPDVVGSAAADGTYLFYDCTAESPSGRRSLCYDAQALHARKLHKPQNSAIEAAAAMGVTLLTEAQYRALQEVEDFDQKTSSWIWTPPDVRERGGALFCDRRYGRVFVYHNGAESYYAARGFRTSLSV